MSKIRFTCQTLFLVICTLAFASFAKAQATRTWVSGVGDDVNPCSRTAPCKTFAGAISKTFINGEIDVLDSAGLGTITITKSITIDGSGGSIGSILASGTTGVNINLTDNSGNDPLHTVRLRNLSINGTGASGTVGTRTGVNGIRVILAAGSVFVERCSITDFSNRGITDERTTGGKLFVSDTTVRNNGSSGVVLLPASGSTAIRATFDNCHFDGNGNAGLVADNGSRVTVSRSTANGNVGAGFFAESLTGTAEMNVESCISANNATGVLSGINATVRLSNTTITNNTSNGLSFSGGAILTFGNNKLGGNAGTQTGMSAAVPGVQ